MNRRFGWLAALALSLAGCSGEQKIDGFKDIKFGTTEAALQNLGFECSTTTHQCERPDQRTVPVAPITDAQMAAASPERGADAFWRCSACHTLGRGGENGIGPNLWSIVGDDIASASRTFDFSAVLSKKPGRWDASTLDLLLSGPRAFAPGNKMTSAPLEDPQMRADIISYLNSQSAHPVALTLTTNPATVPPAQSTYTLFGKTGLVTIDLGKDGAEAISVGVQIPAEQLKELYAKQFGAPASFSDTDVFGGRLTRFYWRFDNGTAIIVTKRDTKGALQPQAPAWLTVDENAFSSALYLAPSRATQMLSRAKGNQVDSTDL